MKKIILPMLALSLISLCFAINLNAQSSEKDLDQVELMKQFTGTWTGEWREDTTILWEFIPSGKGYEHIIHWQAMGETYQTNNGIIGFTWEYKTVNMYTLWQNGMLSRDMGKFVSDKKITWERFDANHKNVLASMEMVFLTPDKFMLIFTARVKKEDTWVDDKVTEAIYTRVKK